MPRLDRRMEKYMTMTSGGETNDVVEKKKGEAVGLAGHRAHQFGTRFVEIALGDVGRVEVDHRSSRSAA